MHTCYGLYITAEGNDLTDVLVDCGLPKQHKRRVLLLPRVWKFLVQHSGKKDEIFCMFLAKV